MGYISFAGRLIKSNGLPFSSSGKSSRIMKMKASRLFEIKFTTVKNPSLIPSDCCTKPLVLQPTYLWNHLFQITFDHNIFVKL